MKWLELSVETPAEFVEPLSHIFHLYGHGGVVVEQQGGFNPDEGEARPTADRVTVKTYLPINSTTEERRNRIDLGVRLVAHVGPISSLRENVLDEEEWETGWKQYFHVLRIGRKTVVRPTWRDYKSADPSDIVITLDPGMAFGTGHHPTTKMCLELLEVLVLPGTDVLDVGCGSGILSIAAEKLGARSVFGLDVDSVAVTVAKQNVRENGLEPAVRIVQGSLPHPDVRERGFDVAVANISAKVVSEIAGELARAVRSGGKLVCSGILTENRQVVERALLSTGCLLEQTIVDSDWVTLVASV